MVEAADELLIHLLPYWDDPAPPPAATAATQVLQGIRDRNNLDTSWVDDVVMGCVSPVGEQGANIARVAALICTM